MQQERDSSEAVPKTCGDCGESKSQDAFELLPTGGRRGTCKACRAAKATASKQEQRAKEERDKPAKRLSEATAHKNAFLHDMFASRERRALNGAVQQAPSGICTLALVTGGYISVAEFAKRVAEREEAMRAYKRHKGRPEDFETPSEAPSVPNGGQEVSDADSGGDLWTDALGDWSPAWLTGGSQHLEQHQAR